MFDISITSEHAFKVNPLSLDINPNIEEDMNSVQLILPRRSLLFELFVVRGMPHSLQRVQVLTALGKQVIEAADKTTLVLVVDKIKRVVLPCLTNRFQEFFQCHFTLSLGDDVANHCLCGCKLQIPNISERKGNEREPLTRPQSLVDFLPVSFSNSFRLHVGKQRIDSQQLAKHILNVFEGRVLAHPTRHLLGHLDQAINVLTKFPRLDTRPERVTKIIETLPNGR